MTRELGRPDALAVAKAKTQGLGGAVADGLRIIGRSRWLVAALGGVSVVMLGVGAINVLFIPFLVERPRREPGVGRSPRGRPDALDDPRRRPDGRPVDPVQHPAPVRRRHRRPGPVRRPAVDRARAVGPPDRDVRGRLVRDAGAGDDDDDRPARDHERDARPRRGRAQRRHPDGVDRVHGGGRHPRGHHRDPRGVRGRRRWSRCWRRSSPGSCSAASGTRCRPRSPRRSDRRPPEADPAGIETAPVR